MQESERGLPPENGGAPEIVYSCLVATSRGNKQLILIISILDLIYAEKERGAGGKTGKRAEDRDDERRRRGSRLTYKTALLSTTMKTLFIYICVQHSWTADGGCGEA